MPMAYDWDAGRRLLRTRIWGEAGDDDLGAHLRALVADVRIRGPLRELVDMSGAESVSFSAALLQQLATAARAHGDRFLGMRTAIVAPSDVLFGISRMYEMLADSLGSPIEVAVFRDVDHAEDWLLRRDMAS